jgi:hydrophobe/amphiphile efflux-1 (HAE1) family protein
MRLPEIGVHRPVATAMFFIAIVVMGLVSLTQLAIDMMPNIEIPTVGVITTYQGAGSQEVESRITEPIEDQVSTTQGLDKIESFSQEGISVVSAQFDWGHDLDAAINDIRDKVDLAKTLLPDDADDPILFKFDLSMMPVIFLAVTAQESYQNLFHLAEKEIADPLKRIPGVATATVRGGREREIHVDIDLEKLHAFHLAVDQVINVLRAQNLSLPGGHIKTGKTDFLVRTPAEFRSVDEINHVVVAYSNGVPVFLQEIATVEDRFKELTRDVRVDGKQGVVVMVQKQSGANTVAVAERVRMELEGIGKGLPSDVDITIAMDSSDDIKRAIDSLKDAVFYGLLFVVLVILFFIRNLRGSLIVAISIPASLIVSFLFLYLAGYTINIISLISLAIAIGMVVDDSIVVFENIFSHAERGERRSQASVLGASEVGNAVTAATFTNIAVFVPIIFVGGITGIMFKQLAYVICLALLTSLVTALVLVPMLTSKLLKEKKDGKKHIKAGILGRLSLLSEGFFNGMDTWYSWILGWSLSHKKTVMLTAVVLLAGSAGLVPLIGTEFIPEQDQGQFQATIELPEGTRMEETGMVVNALEDIMYRNVPERRVFFSSWGIGEEGISTLMGGSEGSNIGSLYVMLVNKENRGRTPKEIAEDLRPHVGSFPGADVRFSVEDSLSSMMFGGGKPFQLEIYGYDLERAKRLSREIAGILKTIPGITDIEISRKEGKPELQIIVDREKASKLGLNVSAVAQTIRTYISGTVATQFREKGDEYDIRVRLMEKDREHIEDIARSFVRTSSGKAIPLSTIADIKHAIGPVKIERKGQERIVTITAGLYKRDLGSAVEEAREKLKRIELPEGFSYKFSGAREEQEKSFRLLFVALLLGAGLVYLVMAAQFESLRDPFIIFFSIPFGIIGVIWAMLLTGQTLSVISFIGLIMLLGIVVKNAIVLIDYINILRKRRFSVRDAVIQGGKNRLRPVLMTAFTTMLSMLPLALSSGQGAEIWNSMGITVIGGLLVSTLITLIFVPTLYAIFEERTKNTRV